MLQSWSKLRRGSGMMEVAQKEAWKVTKLLVDSAPYPLGILSPPGEELFPVPTRAQMHCSLLGLQKRKLGPVSRNSVKWGRQVTTQFQYGVALVRVRQQITESAVAILSGKKFISGCYLVYTIIGQRIDSSWASVMHVPSQQGAVEPGRCLRNWKLQAPKPHYLRPPAPTKCTRSTCSPNTQVWSRARCSP